MNNIITPLVSASELLILNESRESLDFAQKIHQLSLRLAGEVATQKCLTETKTITYQPLLHQVSVAQIVQEIKDIFLNHPAAKDKLLITPENSS